jgi:hypothetical protein
MVKIAKIADSMVLLSPNLCSKENTEGGERKDTKIVHREVWKWRHSTLLWARRADA